MNLNKQQIRAVANDAKNKIESLRKKNNNLKRKKLLQDFKKSKNYKLFNDYHKTFGIKIEDRVIDKVIGFQCKSVYVYIEDLERQIILETIDKDLNVNDLINKLVKKLQ
jgi:hypothetical protein